MKAIAIIDKPNCCAECRLSSVEMHGFCCPFEPILILDNVAYKKIMDWCPLKELNEETTEELRQTFLDEVIRSMK